MTRILGVTILAAAVLCVLAAPWLAPNLDARVCSCMIHIGVSHLAYHAYTGEAQELIAVANRLAPLLE